ncbi:MAG TPA: potassium/proton antiporter [Gammaproteobacteria bacterium]|nr:potassium/proton antiporter [Gammaproteobacteria bacterium]
MEFTDQFIFLSGLLLTLSVLATVPADRSGVPLLAVFLVIGMLAGANGPGGIDFHDVSSAHLIGTIALGVILFDGGLHTPLSSFRTGLGPGLTLATIGVLITTAVTACAVVSLFDVGWPGALLLAAMISSTDAAAVFYLLRARSIEVHARVRNTLEIESGVNDPLAIFLTVALIEWIVGRHGDAGWATMLLAFLRQMAGGAVIGALGGWLLTGLLNRLRLARSLYPLLALGGGFLTFGAASVLGASGFLAAYLAGLIVGNRSRMARRAIQRFHDGMAWLAQIGLFLLLGLLVTPPDLLPAAPEALGVAAVLVFVARPLAVAVCLLPLRFPWQQVAFVSWVGLRGAVPIVLSLFPLLAGVPGSARDFNVIFFVVLLSLLLQGWTVSPVARWLGLLLPRLHPPSSRIDLDRPLDHELVVCELPADCPATRGPIGALEPPEGVRLITVMRDGVPVPLVADVPVQAGDVLYLLVPTADARLQERFDHWLDAVGTAHPREELAYFGEFTVDASAPMAAFAELYLGGVPWDAQEDDSVGAYVRRALRHRASEGDQIRIERVVLVVREMDGGDITQVGVRLPKEAAT